MIKFYKNTKYVSLEVDYYFEFNGKTYKIPQGFLWDGGSIPRIFWNIFGHPFYYKYIEAYLVHDFLFSNYFHNHFFKPNRKEVDERLRKDMGAKKGILMYYAVRIFGIFSYGRELEIDKTKLEPLFN